MKFNEITINTYFMFNGYKYVKNSKCSAQLLEKNRTTYFAQNEVIHVVLGDSNDNI